MKLDLLFMIFKIASRISLSYYLNFILWISELHLFIIDDKLHVVTPSSIDPALLKRYHELYTAVTRARKDKKKKYGFLEIVLFICIF